MPTSSNSTTAELRETIATLRLELENKETEIERLTAELEAVQLESASRWEAIGRLAPAAKRLRAERDQLLAKLKQRGS